MVQESVLHSFLDNDHDLLLHFLDGRKLLDDLTSVHRLGEQGRTFFREFVLTVEPLVSMLQGGEMFGCYLDSEKPYFRLKLEAHHHGAVRSLLLPDDFDAFPESLDGIFRLVQVLAGKSKPYTSVVKLDHTPIRELVDLVLVNSFQIAARVLLDAHADKSILLAKLPPLRRREPTPSLETWQESHREVLAALFTARTDLPEGVPAVLTPLGLRYLGGRIIRFSCDCSRERMFDNLLGMFRSDPASLFDPGAEHLEVRCDYCRTTYEFTRQEFESQARGLVIE